MRKVTHQRLACPGEEDKPTAECQRGREYMVLQKRDVIYEWLRGSCGRGRCMPLFVAALRFSQSLLDPLEILRSNAPPLPEDYLFVVEVRPNKKTSRYLRVLICVVFGMNLSCLNIAGAHFFLC